MNLLAEDAPTCPTCHIRLLVGAIFLIVGSRMPLTNIQDEFPMSLTTFSRSGIRHETQQK